MFAVFDSRGTEALDLRLVNTRAAAGVVAGGGAGGGNTGNTGNTGARTRCEARLPAAAA